MSLYHRLISQVNYWAFLALLISMPFPLPIIRVCWLVWAFTWLLEFRYLHRENIRPHKGLVYMSIGFGVWILWNIVSLLWAEDTQAGLKALGLYASLLALPLTGIFGLNDHYDLKKCLKVFVGSCVISVGIYIFTHFWVINYPYAHDFRIAQLIPVDWLHMDNLLLSIKHRMHYTNLFCMVLPCLFMLFRRDEWYKAVGICLVLLTGIWLTGSRGALINVQIVVLVTLYWFLLRERSVRTKLIAGICVLTVIAACTIVALTLHPRNEKQDIRQTLVVNEEQTEPAVEPRAAIWRAATEHPEDYIVYGVGVGNATRYMMQRYAEHGWTRYCDRHFSPHNQYLCVCIELGIVAALLFVLFWLGIPVFFEGLQQYWILCMTGICMSSMMTDMLLGGLEGIVFIAVMCTVCTLLPLRLETDTEGHE